MYEPGHTRITEKTTLEDIERLERYLECRFEWVWARVGERQYTAYARGTEGVYLSVKGTTLVRALRSLVDGLFAVRRSQFEGEEVLKEALKKATEEDKDGSQEEDGGSDEAES